jgi:hypothetical protein
MLSIHWLIALPAIVMAVGAVYIYKAWNKWWIAHPRLSNGPKAQYVPGTTVLVAYCLAVWPFLSWGAGRHISTIIFVVCVLPFLIVGAFHVFVFIKPMIGKT